MKAGGVSFGTAKKKNHGMDNDELRKLLKQFLGKTPHPRICSPWIIKTNWCWTNGKWFGNTQVQGYKHKDLRLILSIPLTGAPSINSNFASVSVSTCVLAPEPVDSRRLISRSIFFILILTRRKYILPIITSFRWYLHIYVLLSLHITWAL